MADLSVRRVAVIAAIAGALVGSAVAGVVAAVSTSGISNATTSGAGGSVTTAVVVRTDLASTEQVGGSISYNGSYTIATPSGYSAQEVAQAQQAVAEDQQSLSADEQVASDASSGSDQTVAMDQTTVDTDQSTLTTDQAAQGQDCAGTSASTPACSADAQKVSQDHTQLTQAQQQLASAQSSATSARDGDQAKVASDQTKLQGDQATLASDEATAVNPGTTFTFLPKVGDVIKEDQPVYSLSNEPVPLLYGPTAAYRAFSVDMSDGADVGELTQDLIALGYGAGLTQSDHYSSATAGAVKRWQTALDLPATGDILLGQVVFEPGPIRVTTVTPTVGASVGGGEGGAGSSGGGGEGGNVLTATSTTPIVDVDLPVTEEYLVKPGDSVSIVLPNGSSTVGGHVETVGSVAVCSGAGGATGGGGVGTGSSSGGSADQSPCASGGSNNTPTVTVTITMDSDPAGASLDQAPVNVDLTTQTVDDVLAVPVTALLALQGGGFGVDVVTDGSTRLVGVTTGIYDNTLVQVSGSGIAAGTRVEVPSS